MKEIKNKFYRYIYKEGKGYRISKDNVHFGYYEDIRDALHDRDNFEKCNWDLGEFVYMDNPNPYLNMELPCMDCKHDNQYIYSNGTNYVIKKSINGVKHYFGTFKSIDEAKKTRNDLIKSDWNGLLTQ